MIDFDGPALTPTFIADVGLTADELLYGFCNSWVDERGVIAVAVSQYRDHTLMDGVLEKLALLLDAERHEVREMAALCNSEKNVDRARVWVFLFAKWIFENDDTPDSFKVIEDLYSAFDYPSSLEGFVGYLPAKPGAATGLVAMEDNWREFVGNETVYFRARRSKV